MDYNSRISLLCPACNGSSFNITDSIFVCANCKNAYSRDQLEKANDGRIRKQINTVFEKQVLSDISKQMKSSLKKAFQGNPYIKVK